MYALVVRVTVHHADRAREVLNDEVVAHHDGVDKTRELHGHRPAPDPGDRLGILPRRLAKRHHRAKLQQQRRR